MQACWKGLWGFMVVQWLQLHGREHWWFKPGVLVLISSHCHCHCHISTFLYFGLITSKMYLCMSYSWNYIKSSHVLLEKSNVAFKKSFFILYLITGSRNSTGQEKTKQKTKQPPPKNNNNNNSTKKKKKKKKKKRSGSDYINRAVDWRLFTGVIPLPPSTGPFACCLWALGRFGPHYTTWTLMRTPPEHPYWCQT